LLLGCWLFAERPERTLARLVQAFRAHVYALIEAVADVLVATRSQPGVVERALHDVRRRRTRLNETALQVTERLEHGEQLARNELGLWILDVELAAERLAVATRRAQRPCPDHPASDPGRRRHQPGDHHRRTCFAITLVLGRSRRIRHLRRNHQPR
jgi:hypothetical protein